MSPYVLPGIDFNKDLFIKSIHTVGLTIDQLASRRRNIDMLALKACIYFLKKNGVHENELSVKFYRDRTNILHHNKVFGQLLAIGDKKAISIYNKLLNSNLE